MTFEYGTTCFFLFFSFFFPPGTIKHEHQPAPSVSFCAANRVCALPNAVTGGSTLPQPRPSQVSILAIQLGIVSTRFPSLLFLLSWKIDDSFYFLAKILLWPLRKLISSHKFLVIFIIDMDDSNDELPLLF